MLSRTGPNLFKIKVRPNWIGLELRYVGPARSEPLNPTSNCYRRSGVQPPIKPVPVTFQLLPGVIVESGYQCSLR
jgi:hypothetical protein